jgi:hypothetical protein
LHLGWSGADGSRHEEQREYQAPGHWHPPSLIEAPGRAREDAAKGGIPTTNRASTQSNEGARSSNREPVHAKANARIG